MSFCIYAIHTCFPLNYTATHTLALNLQWSSQVHTVHSEWFYTPLPFITNTLPCWQSVERLYERLERPRVECVQSEGLSFPLFFSSFPNHSAMLQRWICVCVCVRVWVCVSVYVWLFPLYNHSKCNKRWMTYSFSHPNTAIFSLFLPFRSFLKYVQFEGDL